MRHCGKQGITEGRLCCDDSEYTCLEFKKEWQLLHEAVVAQARRRCSGQRGSSGKPTLYIVAGVPGTGKVRVLPTDELLLLLDVYLLRDEQTGECRCAS